MAPNDEPSGKAWSALGRERRAIVVVDVVESVRLMESNEADQIDRWRRFVSEISSQVLPSSGGRLVKSLGDGMLLEFENVRSAVAAALEIQRRVIPYNSFRDEASVMHLRVGANVADIVRDSLDIYGTGVNLAARIAGLAGPGEIVVSADFRDELFPGLDAEVEDLGECRLKHVTQRVRAYRVGAAGPRPVISVDAANLSLQAAIAVIPFESKDSASDRIVGELLADGVIGQLSLTAELRVISRLSCRAFSGRAARPDLVAAHLQANYLVSGSFHIQGDRLLVSAELCETRSGSVVWADRLVGPTSELTEIHSTLIERISSSVHAAILRREVLQARAHPMPTLESYSLLLGAVNLMHRQTRSDFDRAKALLEHLSERHSRHATPKAWLAKWYAVGAAQGWQPDQLTSARLAGQHVDMALHCEPDNALAWAIKGLLHGYVDADFDAAESAYEEALRNNPNESLAWLFLATLKGWQGKSVEAINAADQAMRLSPLDPLKYYFDSLAGAAMLGARQYDRAIELSRRSIRSNRAHLSTFRVLAIAEALAGDVTSARHTARELLVKDSKFTIASFLQVSPWRVSPDVSLLADALREAGVPAN